jgi:hypothetical protein
MGLPTAAALICLLANNTMLMGEARLIGSVGVLGKMGLISGIRHFFRRWIVWKEEFATDLAQESKRASTTRDF